MIAPLCRRGAAAMALLAGLACGPAMAADRAALPPYSFAYEPQGVDERGMWMMADEDERILRTSSFVIRDEELNAYVRGVLCRTVGEDRCRNVRVYVMRIPQFNATMYANGMMTVWSGLLLRVQNEAELGAVLGHEFGHFEKRHSLNGFKNKRSVSDVLAWLGMVGPNAGLSASLAGYVYSFSRAQETEADLIGIQYLASSAYPSAAAPKVWSRLMAEQDATAAGRKRKVRHSYAAGFFASHPTEAAREAYLSREAAKYADAGDPGAEAYRKGIAKWLPQLLDDQIKLNDFGGSEYLLDQLAASGGSADVTFARAELYSQRGNPRDYVTAAELYREAIAKGCDRPEARRGLGLALLRTQQSDEGKQALRSYLEFRPDAPDGPMIKSLVGN
nr:M48 family metallopeptidase [Sphingomonas sp.]